MNLKTTLEKITSNWVQATKERFTDHPIATLVRNDLVKTVQDGIEAKSSNYIFKSSPGAGNWASVPWLSILNPEVTDSTQSGIYPVYLFCADGSGIYLSLGFGTTQLKKIYGANGAKQKAMELREELRRNDSRLRSWNESIDLKSNTSLGNSYEWASAGAKFYPSDSLPSDNKLFSDLNKLLKIYESIDYDHIKSIKISEGKNVTDETNSINKVEFDSELFYQACLGSKLIFSVDLIGRYISSLITKPFILLTGLSGSGKTKLAQAFAQWISEDDSQYCIVPVGADWTNREPLLGYVNALDRDEYVMPENGALKLMIEANNNQDKPYFLILDEMNLSHVERYFADFLSVMESSDKFRLHDDSEDLKSGVPHEISWPSNLFIIGTVNVDETTYMFSPKVLDRANVIEFKVNEAEIEAFLNSPNKVDMGKLDKQGASMGMNFVNIAQNNSFDDDSPEELKSAMLLFFKELKKVGAEFGYRTGMEINRLYLQLSEINADLSENEKIDIAIMQKLLPKLHGSRRKLCPVLETMAKLCVSSETKEKVKEDFLVNDEANFKDNPSVLYPLSLEKITRMYKGAIDNGFTSYAEA